jgi:U3 small nucleolar RNA-associated protein 7
VLITINLFERIALRSRSPLDLSRVVFMPADLRIKSSIKRSNRTQEVLAGQRKALQKFNTSSGSSTLAVVGDASHATFKASQSLLKESVDSQTAFKLYSFDLPGGPWIQKPSASGKHSALAGRKGQISILDRHKMTSKVDFTVNDSISDVCFLGSDSIVAVAQHKYVYCYTNAVETACIKDVQAPLHLDYLPFHYLLVATTESGRLHYLDTSTGKAINSISSGLGLPQCLRTNSVSGVVTLGHTNGTVSFWSPSMKDPAMRLLSHFGGVTALATKDEYYLITAGQDMKMKVWDIRKANDHISQVSLAGRPARSLDVSFTGKVAVGFGSRISVYNEDIFKQGNSKKSGKYLTHMYPGEDMETVRFCPFEDLLLTGHSAGVGSLLIPGSGSKDIDSYASNPFVTKKQKKESDVKSLLEKLHPDTIQLKL